MVYCCFLCEKQLKQSEYSWGSGRKSCASFLPNLICYFSSLIWVQEAVRRWGRWFFQPVAWICGRRRYLGSQWWWVWQGPQTWGWACPDRTLKSIGALWPTRSWTGTNFELHFNNFFVSFFGLNTVWVPEQMLNGTPFGQINRIWLSYVVRWAEVDSISSIYHSSGPNSESLR